MSGKKFTIARHMIRLERNGDLLLGNGERFIPFVVTEGKGMVIQAMEKISGTLATIPEMQDAFGGPLIGALLNHRILVPETDRGIPNPVIPPPGHKKSGMSIYFLISQACNLGCVYCFATDYKSPTRCDMPWNVAKRTMDRAFDVTQPKGSITINFFGGEPMLNWPLVKQIIAYSEELKKKPGYQEETVKYHVTTNLTMMPEDFIEWLKRYNISVLTDVDGPEDMHDQLRPRLGGGGSHDRILRHIEVLKENGIRYEIRSTITSLNVDRMEEIVDSIMPLQLDNNGCVLEAVCPFEASGNVKPLAMIPDPARYAKNLLQLYRSGKVDLNRLNPINKFYEKLIGGQPGGKIACGAPWTNIWIVDHKGDVYPCTFLTGNPDFLIGNVFDEGEFRNYMPFVQRMVGELHVDKLDNCRDCDWKYLCTGGCPALSLLYERCPVKDPEFDRYVQFMRCGMRKAFYEPIIWDIVDAKMYEARNQLSQAAAHSFSGL